MIIGNEWQKWSLIRLVHQIETWLAYDEVSRNCAKDWKFSREST